MPGLVNVIDLKIETQAKHGVDPGFATQKIEEKWAITDKGLQGPFWIIYETIGAWKSDI